MKLRITSQIKKALRDPGILSMVASMAVSRVQRRIVRGPWTPNSSLTTDVKQGNKPLRDKGELLASVSGRADPGKRQAVVSSTHVAARITHYGGVIKPKRVRKLAIPAGAQARAMMRRYGLTPRECLEGMEAAGYTIWSRWGIVWARKSKSRSSNLIPMFLLRSSIRIPARPWMHLDEIDRRGIARAVLRRALQK